MAGQASEWGRWVSWPQTHKTSLGAGPAALSGNWGDASAAEDKIQGSHGPDLHRDLNPGIALICCVTLGQLPALSGLPRLPALENGFGNKNLTFQAP